MSVPSGRAAPVKIRSASVAPTIPANEVPAAERPPIKEKQCCPALRAPLKAYPSTAEFLKGGVDIIAFTADASVRPSLI